MVSLPFDYKETTPSRACWSSSVRGFFSLPSISPTQNHAYPINIRGAAEPAVAPAPPPAHVEQLFATTTDRDGAFSITRKVDPPGFWIDLDIQISATLVEPAGIAAVGTLDIDAEDGTPSNEQRAFRLESGKKTSLLRNYSQATSGTSS